jgi:ABC-type uncharacterized transport system involved in gliding motility auxiliary subunit
MALNSTQRKRLAAGTNAGMVTVLVAVALVLVYLLAGRFRVRIDLSADQASTLAPDTRQKLRLLEQGEAPVTITVFSAQPGRPETAAKNQLLRDLSEEIDHASAAVRARFVDFDRERLSAEALGVTEYGTMVIQRGAQRVDLGDRDLFRSAGKGPDRRLEFLGESAFARASAQLLEDRQRVLYAITGHGELDPEGMDPGGAAELGRLVQQEHYTLKKLDLVREGPRVPEDASAVLLLRPKATLPPAEEDVLLGALGRGVPLLVAVDTGSPVPALLGRLGVSVGEGYALDPMLVFPYPDRPVPRYRAHPITQDLATQALVTVLSRAAPLQPAVPAREGVRATTLLETSRDGWVERGGEVVNGKSQFDADVDLRGPVSMALALEVDGGSGLVRDRTVRVAVLGDADALTNQLLGEGPGNPTFALNTLRWVVGDEARAAVVGRDTASRRLALTQDDLDGVRSLSLGLGPLLAVVLGAVAWWSRRGR